MIKLDALGRNDQSGDFHQGMIDVTGVCDLPLQTHLAVPYLTAGADAGGLGWC